jgi:diguanylate cyclase (GGDEF)-like protein/PAS domain S-box-containing protein
MLYQSLIAASVLVLMTVCIHSYRTNSGVGRYAITSLYACTLTFILSGLHPLNGDTNPLWLASINILAFAMLFPILFINVKHYTALTLPQWRALRSFSIGIPLLLGLDGVVAGVINPREVVPAIFPPYVWTAYCFALFSILIAAWRFTTTPRQRGPILLLLVVPIMMVVADLSYRLGGWLLFDRNPAISMALVCTTLLSVLLIRRDQFNVRPVARSALIDQVHDLLLVVDLNQRIADCNRAAGRWLGAPESSLIGSCATNWLPVELSELLTGSIAQDVVLPWTKNGQDYWFEVSAADLVIDNEIHGKLVTLRDVSERRCVELALTANRQELERANAKLQELANTDSLTGLANRRFLLERLSSEIERHSRSGLTLGFLMLDLDNFKRINDRYGHPVGDLVLQQAAKCMQQTVRESDVVGRVGGEEFAVIAVDTIGEGPFVLAARLKENLAKIRVATQDGQVLSFTVSIGCIHFHGGVVDADILMTLADQALYTSKNAGRNRVTNRVYSDRAQLVS